MKVRTALLELFKDSSVWRDFFRSCCKTGALRLRSQAWQFQEELKERGHEFPTEGVEDALLGLARKLLPRTPAAQWDAEWAYELCKDVLARLAERYAKLSVDEKEEVDFSAQSVWGEQMHRAGRENNPAAFRTVLKRWERAGVEAIKHPRVKGGAA